MKGTINTGVVRRNDGKLFFCIGCESIEIKSYEMKNSSNGKEEISIIIRGVPLILEHEMESMERKTLMEDMDARRLEYFDEERRDGNCSSL